MRGGGHRNRITREQREEILRLYLEDPDDGVQLAISFGLSQIYAYKLALERGLLPPLKLRTVRLKVNEWAGG